MDDFEWEGFSSSWEVWEEETVDKTLINLDIIEDCIDKCSESCCSPVCGSNWLVFMFCIISKTVRFRMSWLKDRYKESNVKDGENWFFVMNGGIMNWVVKQLEEANKEVRKYCIDGSTSFLWLSHEEDEEKDVFDCNIENRDTY